MKSLDDPGQLADDEKLISAWRTAGGKGKARYAVDYGTPLYWALARDDQRNKIAKRVVKNAKPVKATDLNVWALAQLAKGRTEFPNQIHAVDAPHIRRCLKAGLIHVVGSNLRLTPAGEIAVKNSR